MRDILEDAAKHVEDGFGRAQKLQQRELPRRFYKQATVAPVDDGYAVQLDGRPIRTPGKALVAVPAEALAERLAAEWAAQGETIDPATMPFTRLVNTTVEAGDGVRDALIAEIVNFAGTDLTLYRAESPAELVARQQALWDRALSAFSERFDVRFEPTVGVVHREQPAETLERIGAVAAVFGPFALMALTSATGIAGSAVLTLGAVHGLFGRDFAWDAAHVDEDFNIAQWGEDHEAAERRRLRRADFDAAMDVIGMVGIES